MSLIFSAGGKTETLGHFSIAATSQTVRVPTGAGSASRRGERAHAYGQREDVQRLRVEGTLKATSMTALDTAFDALAEVLNTGPVLLEDTLRDRFAVVHKLSLERRFQPPCLYLVALDLAMTEGTWTEDPDDSPLTYQTAATIGSTKLVRYVHVDLDGSASVFPCLSVALATGGGGTLWPYPWIEWRGRNLFRNSSFEEGVSTPTWWSPRNSPVLRPHHGRTGGRCVRVSRSGATYNEIVYGGGAGIGGVEMDAATTYVVSIYGRKALFASANTNSLIELLFYDASGASITTNTNTQTLTTINWTRHQYSFTTPGTCAFLVVRFGCETAGADIDIDDVQLEKGSVATEFVDTSLLQNRHVTVRRCVEGAWNDLVTAHGETEWMIDARNRRFRVRSSGVLGDDGANVEGRLFDLAPGLNHVYVNAPSSGSLSVIVDHPAEYY